MSFMKTKPNPLTLWLMVVCTLFIASLGFLRSAGAATDLPLYTDALASGWQDWSWSNTSNYANTSPVHGGTNSIAVTLGGWGGLQLGYSGSLLDVSTYNTLRFWIHGGMSGGQPIQVWICTANPCNGMNQMVTPQANAWTQVEIALSNLPSKQMFSIQWINNSGSNQPVFYLDDMSFIGQPETPLALSVDALADQHPISPYIYGINFAGEVIAKELRLPIRRWGGNATSRYNWQRDVHNTGSDWYFENLPEDNDYPEFLPNGSLTDRFVDQDRRTGTKSILTMPLMGWTPKRRQATHPYDCGFPVNKYGAQDSTDPWDTNCGDGMHNNAPVTGNDPTDTSLAITSTFVTDWINHLITVYGTAAGGGVMFYNLDNEPMLWNSTHRDVHPLPTSYNEVRDRTWTYAAAIKAADPTAQTLGPVGWGWCEYFYSAVDQCSPGGADYQAHGGIAFVEWYLQQMMAYQDTHSVRILDYLDEHYYPAANGVALSPAGSPDVQALRLRSTRSLWDPTYVDESWIAQTAQPPPAVQLIPRMKQWVTKNYPGTKLAITEYNWGALDDINGALAQADVLGIFGREGLDLATLWDPPNSATAPGIFAFRMYRNVDGQGSAFGETGIRALSNDQGRLAIYGAKRSGGALTLQVINKTGQSITSPVALTGFQPAPTAQVYRYSAANLTAIVPQTDQAVTASGFTADFPANSITFFVVPAAPRYDLTVLKVDTGIGTVTSSPTGINCGMDCTEPYAPATRVTLTATAASDSTFMGWSGGGCSGTSTCVVTMDANQTVNAMFNRRLPDFVVTGITLTPTSPAANTTFTANVTVTNQGAASGDGKRLTVWSNRTTVQTCGASGGKSVTVGTLANGASKTLTITRLTAGAKGAKMLRAFVDSGCATAESNEGNNQFTTSYTVR